MSANASIPKYRVLKFEKQNSVKVSNSKWKYLAVSGDLLQSLKVSGSHGSKCSGVPKIATNQVDLLDSSSSEVIESYLLLYFSSYQYILVQLLPLVSFFYSHHFIQLSKNSLRGPKMFLAQGPTTSSYATGDMGQNKAWKGKVHCMLFASRLCNNSRLTYLHENMFAKNFKLIREPTLNIKLHPL